MSRSSQPSKPRQVSPTWMVAALVLFAVVGCRGGADPSGNPSADEAVKDPSTPGAASDREDAGEVSEDIADGGSADGGTEEPTETDVHEKQQSHSSRVLFNPATDV